MHGFSHQENGGRRRKRWSDWPRGAKIAVAVAAAVVLIPTFFLLFGFITMWLWNWLMPAIFHLPTIGFWQAWGLLALSHILFKSGQMRKAGRSHWKKEKIRDRMAEPAPEPKPE